MELGGNDFDNKTKKEDKPFATSIKREHDSLDDFEHLDPEISPLKDLPPVGFPTKVEVQSDSFRTDLNLDSLSKTEPSKQTINPTDDLLSDFSTDFAPKIETSVLENVEFESTHTLIEPTLKDSSLFDDYKGDSFSVSSKDDVMKFLEAETSNNDKTEKESDLKLTSDDISPPKSDPLTYDNVTKPLDNVGEHFDVLTENFPNSLPSKPKTDTDSSIKFESQEDFLPSTNKKSDFETEDFDYKNESTSSVGEVEHKTQENKQDIITDSPVEEYKPIKPLTPVVETKNINEIKLSEAIKPSELDEFLDTEPEPKPVPVIVPVKPVEQDIKPAKTKTPSLDDIIGPEDVFKKIGLDAWFNPDRLHPKVEALIYWRDPKKSGVVFGGILAILLSLAYLSLISVVAYVSLFTLFGTIIFRVYKSVLQAVQKTSDGHPFKEFLELELELPQDKVRELTDTAVTHINAAVVELRRLFLVEDLVDSIKFAVLLWCLTYIGALFNGLTLVILGFVALFTVPKVYENNKASIDQYLDIGRSKIAEITNKVKAAVPIGKKEAEKEKDQ